MKMKLVLFIAFSIFATGFAVVQEITIYDDDNYEGNSVTFKGKYPDLTDWLFFLDNAKTYCITGWIYLFDGLDYRHTGGVSWTSGFHLDRYCRTGNFGWFQSGRLVGPLDTETPSLAIYEGGPNSTHLLQGEEIIITGVASNNFPFEPVEIISFGNSSWTLFTENDFAGDSWCLESPDNGSGLKEYVTNSTHPVRSVIRGCTGFDIV